ncbi:hypothetical protein [Olivibacter domesticus]|uniref:Uncharacterized protein n=1 Tax=Olivibacter domesticus TaxID=407022 RepID=A0A1H7SRD2_OLID1|nr:hypothetical protein [Olivibacter domesticus]SEL75180.1 hypothetical protein SAMN05661044_03343 [Olivibacter domesticus]
MTFEDFFIKKRIDLLQLQEAEPLLYNEFKRHFELMGEKSFDHTKKFWFNRLRKSFHLKEEVSISKPLPGPSSTEEQKTIAVEDAPQAAKPTGFKPRFKAVKLEESDEKETSEKEEKSSNEREGTPQKPVGFKPRFKAGQTSSAGTESSSGKEVEQDDTSNKAENPTNESASVNKPSGFKPRFKAGITKAADAPQIDQPIPSERAQHHPEKADRPNDETAQSLEETKPLGFKPRFKAGITNRKASDGEKTQEEITKEQSKTDIPPLDAAATVKEGDKDQVSQKPMGFKPRFKAGLTKQIASNNEDAPVKAPQTPSIETEEQGNEKSLPDDVKSMEETKAPLGFKPRFKPKKKDE